MKWEFKTEKFDSKFGFLVGTTFDSESMNRTLNKFGKEGWELMSVSYVNKLKSGRNTSLLFTTADEQSEARSKEPSKPALAAGS